MTELMRQLSEAMADRVESAAASVVRVEARRRLPATGIVWADNLVVTAHHVVEYEDDIAIGLADGARAGASLIGRDPHNDLALLQTEAALTAANWTEDGGLRVGHLVLALGRPTQNIQAALGVVSGLANPTDVKKLREKAKAMRRNRRHGRRGRGRRGGWGRSLAAGYIQTDVIMYPGFSGGPLLGGDGKIHGLNTSGFSRGVSIAVPAATIRKSIAALLTDGKIQPGYLGIGVQPARLPDGAAESLDQDTGLLIVSVEADSPAAKAGLMVGDIVTALDDEAVEAVDELHILLANTKVDSEVAVMLVRGGAVQTASATVGARG